MSVDTSILVPMTEANQNFSKVARLVDEKGAAIILKNNKLRYLVMEFSRAEAEQAIPNEALMQVSQRIMEKNREAYEVLAQ